MTKQPRDEAYKLTREEKQREEGGEENLRIVRGKLVKDQRRTVPAERNQQVAEQHDINVMNHGDILQNSKTMMYVQSTPVLSRTGLMLGALVLGSIKQFNFEVTLE